jgi:RNA polymerase sigma-70 factor, ECF subfamily
VSVSDVIAEALEQDLEALFQEHYDMAYRTAYGVIGNAQDAEDVAQSVFLQLLRRKLPPEILTNPRAYIYRAAVNLSLNAIKRRSRQVFTNDPEQLELQTATDPSDQAEELHRRLYEAVAELHPHSAHILILRYIHNYSDAQIARLLGTSRGTIAVSLYRSRARLKKLMRGSHPLGDRS